MKPSLMYYLSRTIMGLSFHMLFTAAGLYRIDIAKLEVYQLILIGTALEISIFIFEVPTGIVADLKSRKLSVIIGLFIISIGAVLEALTPLFLVIFLAQFIWGFGYTFISGAMDAWVSDEIRKDELERVVITGSQVYQLASVVGIVLAALIGLKDIRTALYVSGGLTLFLAVISIFFMVEKKMKKRSSENQFFKDYFSQLKDGFSHIAKHKTLRIMFVIMLFYGLYSEGIDRSYEVYILDGLNFRELWNLAPIWILAIVNASIAILGYLMLFVIKRYLKKGHHIYIWAMNLTMMMIVGIILFALLGNSYFALFGFIFFSLSREGTYPLLNTILLKNTPSNVKAIVLSSFGQLDAIGQLLSGGLMVLISLGFAIKGLYLVTAMLLVVPVLLFIRLKRMHYVVPNNSLQEG
jgi:DHA3 family tetracycline resistance protein-like MFS transporter